MNKADSIKLTEKHVLVLMYNALCSLNFLHSTNLMHRDIKPANILVDQQCQVKICDLGLSRAVPDNLLIPDTKLLSSPNQHNI